MQYPCTASIILVQLDPDSEVTAYVGYPHAEGEARDKRVELKLPNPSDAVDRDMWMQMITALLCDAL